MDLAAGLMLELEAVAILCIAGALGRSLFKPRTACLAWVGSLGAWPRRLRRPPQFPGRHRYP